MIPSAYEENIKKVVYDFVKNLNGIYKKHISDEALSSIIVHRLGTPPVFGPFTSITIAELIVEKGMVSYAYHSTCWLFEAVLENGCGCLANGHHAAQEFAKAMECLVEVKK